MSSILHGANACPSKQQQAKANTDFELKLQLRSGKQQGAPAKILPKSTQNTPAAQNST
jgi:hypothetical protein